MEYKYKYYKLLDVETGEDVYINPKYIVFYKRTEKGVLIDIGSKRFIALESDFEEAMFLDGVMAW